MHILLGGGSGFVGQLINEALLANGHQCTLISRSPGQGRLTWKDIETLSLPPCDAIINLAGANIMDQRWTPQYKREMFASRVDTTRLLVKKISESETPPKVFISSSAVGWYPSSLTETYDEEAVTPGTGLLGEMCKQWESAAVLPEGSPTRSAIVRIGLC